MKRHIVLVVSLFLCLACRPGVSVVGEIDALPEIFPDFYEDGDKTYVARVRAAV